MRTAQMFDQPFGEHTEQMYRLFMYLKGNHGGLALHSREGGVQALGYVPFNSSATRGDRELAPGQEDEALADRLSRDMRGHHTKLYLRRRGEFLSSALPLPVYRRNRRYTRLVDEMSTFRDILQTRLEKAQQNPEENADKIREIEAALAMDDRALLIKYLTRPYSRDIDSVVVEVGLLTEEQRQSLCRALIMIDNTVRRSKSFTIAGIERNCSGLALRAIQESGVANSLEVARSITEHAHYDPVGCKGHLSVYGYLRLNAIHMGPSIIKDIVLQPTALLLGGTVVIPYLHLRARFATAAHVQPDAAERSDVQGLGQLPTPTEQEQEHAERARSREGSVSSLECG